MFGSLLFLVSSYLLDFLPSSPQATLIDYLDLHLELRGAYLFIQNDLAFGLVEELVCLEASHTGDDFRAILSHIVYLDDSFEGAILLQCFGIKDIDLQLH